MTTHQLGPIQRGHHRLSARCSCGERVTSTATANDTALYRAFDKHRQRAKLATTRQLTAALQKAALHRAAQANPRELERLEETLRALLLRFEEL